MGYEPRAGHQILTSARPIFAVISLAALISFWVCRGENRGSAVQAAAMQRERGSRAMIDLPKRGGSMLSIGRAHCTKVIKSYGTATEMGWRDRQTPRWVPSGVVTSSLAPELSITMHVRGGVARVHQLGSWCTWRFSACSSPIQAKRRSPQRGSSCHVKSVPLSIIS